MIQIGVYISVINLHWFRLYRLNFILLIFRGQTQLFRSIVMRFSHMNFISVYNFIESLFGSFDFKFRTVGKKLYNIIIFALIFVRFRYYFKYSMQVIYFFIGYLLQILIVMVELINCSLWCNLKQFCCNIVVQFTILNFHLFISKNDADVPHHFYI